MLCGCENVLRFKAVKGDGKAEADEHVPDLIEGIFIDQLSFPGNICSDYAPEGNTFPVGKLKILQFFDRVPGRVSEIEQSPLSLFLRIPFNDPSFDMNAADNHLPENFRIPFPDLSHMIQAPFIVRSVPDQSMLQDLSHAACKLPVVERL